MTPTPPRKQTSPNRQETAPLGFQQVRPIEQVIENVRAKIEVCFTGTKYRARLITDECQCVTCRSDCAGIVLCVREGDR